MSRTHTLAVAAVTCALLLSTGPARALPFANEVISYTAGLNVTPGFDDPSHALGMPATSNGDFGDVTPFNGAFLNGDLVQVGDGGELVVRFAMPVLDHPLNPFGIDLLVFGNAFFFQPDLFGDSAEDVFADPALIEVSQHGKDFSAIAFVFADDLFPTSAFTDTPGPFDSGGSALSDFTRPVDPAVDWFGKSYAEIVALYDGSGGGAGIDLSETGLPWIRYVRITSLGGVTAEIDAFADVAAVPAPEPAAAALLLLAVVGARLLRVRRDRYHRTAKRRAAGRL